VWFRVLVKATRQEDEEFPRLAGAPPRKGSRNPALASARGALRRKTGEGREILYIGSSEGGYTPFSVLKRRMKFQKSNNFKH